MIDTLKIGEPGRCSVAKVMTVILLCVSVGCGDSSNVDQADTGSAELRFEEPEADLGAVPDARFTDHQFKFSVVGAGAARIVSVDKSCGCLSIGDDVIGRTLESGQEYQLPVRINLRDKVIFSESLVVTKESGSTTVLRIRGVRESSPRPDPTQVLCEYTGNTDSVPSGTFFVHRFRHEETPRLIPEVTEFETEHLAVSFGKDVTDITRQPQSPAARDFLEWNWRLRSIPSTDLIETIRIPWSNPEIPATEVTFHILERAPVRGLVKRLFCGRLNAGETWQHTLTLHIPQDHRMGPVTAVHSTCDFITTEVERHSPLTLIHVTVRAPAKAGAIDESIEVRFENSAEAPESIHVFGSVRAEPVAD